MNRAYSLYAALVAAAMACAVYYGYSFAGVDQVKHVPKTVRDNPGAYRAHYRSYARYYGGK